MRTAEAVFVDTGAWIALALTSDPLHARARSEWTRLHGAGVRLRTSLPVVIETFTFLDRNATRLVALTWKDSLARVPRLKVLACTVRHLDRAWPYFERRDLHKLSLVDACSFVLMAEQRIRLAFAFDTHFSAAGFTLVG